MMCRTWRDGNNVSTTIATRETEAGGAAQHQAEGEGNHAHQQQQREHQTGKVGRLV